jgi:spore coat protein CotF
VLGLVTDPALARPTAGAMAKTGEAALRDFGAATATATGETFLPRLRSALKDHVGSNAQCVRMIWRLIGMKILLFILA